MAKYESPPASISAMQSSGFQVKGLGFGGLGFQGLGFRVSGHFPVPKPCFCSAS